MNEMATDTYMPSLERSLLNDPIDKSSLTEQEAMRTEADPMTLVYRDCLFGKEVFYAKNDGIRSKDHVLSLVESEKKALCHRSIVQGSLIVRKTLASLRNSSAVFGI
uniref:Uncharacterized protein n=1 Tax=Rhizophagus irregularis (strain DAOM 181602 / DAOM 197198 / MUCL 43194) TaxID=747089 RepID=U9SPY6_RHIID